MTVARLMASASGGSTVCLRDEPPADPQTGEVLVRLRAASLNPHDEFVRRGFIPSIDGVVPLTDGAGEVMACGAGVEELAPGDAVISTFWPHWHSGEMTERQRREVPGEMVDGFARHHACMPERAFTRAPRGLSPAQAATLPCAGVTAWRALVSLGRIKAGDVVLVIGSGAVALFALQFATMAGARVIATTTSPHKQQRLLQLGASDVIDSTATPDWATAARRLTGGRGVDHVIEVGGPATFGQSMRACRLGGHVAVIGVLTGVEAQIDVRMLFTNQLRISGISIGSRTDQLEMIRAIEVKGLQPVIDSTFTLASLGAAFERLGAPDRFGKVIVEL
jgi:NADPH:quinone reductase-like Zn-dependent oxidoreductase